MRKLSALLIVFLVCVAPCRAQSTVDVTGSSVGIADTAPPFWPHGSSLESLGFGALYPNGPQFGLSNTSGGFGAPGEGRTSGVGLSHGGVSMLVQQELQRGNVSTERQIGVFRLESARSASLFSSILGGQFRLEMSQWFAGEEFEPWDERQALVPSSVPSPGSILQDTAPSMESILNPSL